MGVLRAADTGGVPEMGTPGWVVLGSGTPAGSRYGVTAPPPPLGAGAAGRALLGGVEGHSAAAPGRHKSLRCGGGPALGGRAGGARTAADGARERGEAVGHPRGRAVREGGAAGAAALPGRECGGGRGGGLGRGWAAGSADGRARERIAARGCGTRVGVRGAHRCLWPCPAVDGDVGPRSPTAAPLRLQPPRTPGCPALSPTPPPRPSPPRPPQGSLQHFLRQHVSPWAGSVRLALSLARGLAFLHQELWRDGERPPPPPSPHVRPRSR